MKAVRPPEPAKEKEDSSNVIDLLDALRRSVKGGGPAVAVRAGSRSKKGRRGKARRRKRKAA